MPVPEDLNLVFMPREFQYAGDTFDARYHFIGPSRRTDSAAGWEPPTGDRRLLFISLGTTFNSNPGFFRSCFEAFGDTDWNVVMAIGTKVTAADLGTVPDNFDVRPFFPQQAVLEHAAAFVTHAGMNSVMEGAWHQVPMAAVPQMPEQAANARRISQLDLGTIVGDGGLREAVDAVADDPKIKAGLVAGRRAIDNAGGADAGVDAIEKYLLR
ncbi:nucleotide disphospho-sugar-binding domain-containing protein [Kribbella sp. NPDC058245]|uniref:nucleotide disphospho-sugar-binding domain-containing protein n=1 Tax=Kribbella sp. NPDC058245 TaxID=3346399 RepID=UPI0036EA5993